ncbi:MAG TPA: hypothetical protein VIH61_01100 [Waddliaceae bacterium]
MNPDSHTLRKGNIYAVPITHYNMESAAQVHLAFKAIKPDCVAVELAETMQLQILHAASRLPDISIVVASNNKDEPIYYICEPCDGAFEGLRCALEARLPAYCIDLDIDDYPDVQENLPDPYSIQRIGLKQYYEIYRKNSLAQHIPTPKIDLDREMFMARRLKELSLSYDKILFVGGMAHIENILKLIDNQSFPNFSHAGRNVIELCTLTEMSCREVMAETGWITKQYEKGRREFDKQLAKKLESPEPTFPPDRQKLIFQLYKEAAEQYKTSTGNTFPGYHLRNIMKFARNYAFIYNKLMPDIYQILTAAKGCVDHNYAYETWDLATTYPFRSNIDNLPEVDLSIEQVWGHSKIIRFHLKSPSRKPLYFQHRKKDRSQFRFEPPGRFSICSYPPEDIVVENFGKFLQKKGTQIFTEEGARTIPFSTSLEDGVDSKETIRHWNEKKLYVKIKGKPPGGVGSVVVIFDEDNPQDSDEKQFQEKYPWKTTWMGEHDQESDMAFYATPMGKNIVGPGISRCEYGGFMMSYPPRRMFDIWQDPDYQVCRTKSEILLVAAIDYAVKSIVVFVASKPPRAPIKSFAKRYGKKIVYIPIGQLSPVTLNRLRAFHVLDGHDKRRIADEYIY